MAFLCTADVHCAGFSSRGLVLSINASGTHSEPGSTLYLKKPTPARDSMLEI